VSDEADRTSAGKLFQSRGPAVANDRSPTVTDRDGRTSRRLEVDERRRPLRSGKSTLMIICPVKERRHIHHTHSYNAAAAAAPAFNRPGNIPRTSHWSIKTTTSYWQYTASVQSPGCATVYHAGRLAVTSCPTSRPQGSARERKWRRSLFQTKACRRRRGRRRQGRHRRRLWRYGPIVSTDRRPAPAAGYLASTQIVHRTVGRTTFDPSSRAGNAAG